MFEIENSLNAHILSSYTHKKKHDVIKQRKKNILVHVLIYFFFWVKTLVLRFLKYVSNTLILFKIILQDQNVKKNAQN